MSSFYTEKRQLLPQHALVLGDSGCRPYRRRVFTFRVSSWVSGNGLPNRILKTPEEVPGEFPSSGMGTQCATSATVSICEGAGVRLASR